MKKVLLSLFSLGLCLLLPCVSLSETVTASFFPIYLFASNLLAGTEGIALHSLAQPQTGCLHDYQLSSGDLRALSDTDVFLINGAGMEGFLSFVFEGFLPGETKERKAILADLTAERRTIILYEAPHRLVKTLQQLQEALGGRRICICRELTKLHEEAVWTTLPEAVIYWTEHEPRGEYVLILEGLSEEEASVREKAHWKEISLHEHLDQYLEQGLDKKEAMKRMAQDRGISRRDIYQGLLEEE